MKNLSRSPCLTILITAAIFAGGCSGGNQPRPRMGSYAASTPGTHFIDLRTLGKHHYDFKFFETNGIFYTCRGGHIDIAHLRIAADHVRYFYESLYPHLMEGRKTMSFSLNVDHSVFYAVFSYPPDWNSLDKKEKKQIARLASLELAQYFTHAMVSWHEVLTFYGYKTMGFLPEFPSAFSWEDTYSNAAGVYLGAKAVLSEDESYNEAVTRLLQEELEWLGAQTAAVSRTAAESMRGRWFDGTLFVTMYVRNTDIGLHDGLVWPMLVPEICPDAKPQPYPAPGLEVTHQYGIGITLEVEPREFEAGQILQRVYPEGGKGRIDIATQLPLIMAAIEQQILDSGGTFFRDGRFFVAEDDPSASGSPQ